MKNSFLLSLVFVLLSFQAGASSLEDSLTSAYISAMKDVTVKVETSKFWWIGTTHGLYCIRKKNGRISHFTASNSVFPSSRISAIAVMSNGEVYIGTDKGIVRYDNYSFLLINKENSRLSCNEVVDLRTRENILEVITTCGRTALFHPGYQ